MNLQLSALRKAANLTQQEMADRLDVKVATYRTWENQKRNMSFPQAIACAEILGCTLDELAGRSVPRSFADPGQQTLNVCYESMNPQGKNTLVTVARSLERDAANRMLKDGREDNQGLAFGIA